MKAKEKKLSRTFFKIMFLWIALCFLFTPIFTIRPLSDDAEKLTWSLKNGPKGLFQGAAITALEYEAYEKDGLAIDAILPMLENDVDKIVRYTAAACLSLGGKDKRVLDALIHTMKNDTYRYARFTAAWALNEIGNKRAIDALIDSLENNSNDHTREMIASLLRKTKDKEAVKALIRAFENDASEDVRWSAARALGEIKDKESVEPLLRILENDTNYEVRERAAEALGEIEDKEAVKPLLHALGNDADYNVREWAARALGEIKDKEAVGPLLRVLENDADEDVRRAAAEALGSIGDARAIAPLMEILRNDDDSENRVAAGLALLKMEDVPLDELTLAPIFLNRYSRNVYYAIREIKNDRAVGVLAAMLKLKLKRTKYDREKIAKTLGKIGNSRAVEVLTEMLGSEGEQDVLKQIVESLRKIKKDSAPDFFLGLLNDEESGKRRGAARALKIDESPKYGGAVAQALKTTENSRTVIKPLFMAWMRDRDKTARQYARESLFRHIWKIARNQGVEKPGYEAFQKTDKAS